MALATSYTLNTTATGDMVFNQVARENRSVRYEADSPQDDLVGKRELRISHRTSGADIEETLVQLIAPIYDSGDSSYKGHTRVNVTIKRPRTADRSDNVEPFLEAIHELLATTGLAASLANSEL